MENYSKKSSNCVYLKILITLTNDFCDFSSVTDSHENLLSRRFSDPLKVGRSIWRELFCLLRDILIQVRTNMIQGLENHLLHLQIVSWYTILFWIQFVVRHLIAIVTKSLLINGCSNMFLTSPTLKKFIFDKMFQMKSVLWYLAMWCTVR